MHIRIEDFVLIESSPKTIMTKRKQQSSTGVDAYTIRCSSSKRTSWKESSTSSSQI